MALFSRHLSDRTLASFFMQLGRMLKSGLDIRRSMDILAKQTRQFRLKGCVKKIQQGIEQGHTLRQSMDPVTLAFPPLVLEMISVSEDSGTLDEVCRSLSEHYQWKHNLRSQTIFSMIYPATLLLVAVHVPWVVQLFKDPVAANRYLMTVYAIIGGLFVGSVILIRSLVVRRVVGSVLLNFPIVSNYYKLLLINKFTEGFRLAYDAGLGIPGSLVRGGKATGSLSFSQRLEPAIEKASQGMSLGEAISDTHLFNMDFIAVVETADHSGELSKALKRLSREYRERGRMATKWLVRVLTGAIYCVIVIYVAWMVITLFTETVLNPLKKINQEIDNI